MLHLSADVVTECVYLVILFVTDNAAVSNDSVAGKFMKSMMSKLVFGTQEFPVSMQNILSKFTSSFVILS